MVRCSGVVWNMGLARIRGVLVLSSRLVWCSGVVWNVDLLRNRVVLVLSSVLV